MHEYHHISTEKGKFKQRHTYLERQKSTMLTMPNAGEDMEQQTHSLLVEMQMQPLLKTIWKFLTKANILLHTIW